MSHTGQLARGAGLNCLLTSGLLNSLKIKTKCQSSRNLSLHGHVTTPALLFFPVSNLVSNLHYTQCFLSPVWYPIQIIQRRRFSHFTERKLREKESPSNLRQFFIREIVFQPPFRIPYFFRGASCLSDVGSSV